MFKNGIVIGNTADGQDVWSRCDTADNHIHDDFFNEEVVRDIIGTIAAGDAPFMRMTLDMGAPVGRSALVEIRPDDIAFYARRGDRAGMSHMVLRDEKELTNVATVILCRDKDNGGRLTIVSAFPGEPGEREPWDESIQDDSEKVAKSEAFWKTHALIASSEEIKAVIDEYYAERDWLDSYRSGGMLSLEWSSRNRMLEDYYRKVVSKLKDYYRKAK